MINTAMGLGVSAVRLGMNHLDSIANEIATQPVHAVDPIGQPAGRQTGTNSPAPRDLVEPLTELNQATYTVRAGVKVIEVGNKMMGTVLDLMA